MTSAVPFGRPTATVRPAGPTMSVGVMVAPGRIELREMPVPVPGPGEVLVRLRASAICTWEQRTFSGRQPNDFPFVGGHETAGEVVALGPDVTGGPSVGDRVSLGPSSCGRCHWCLTGQDRACARHYAGAVRYGDAWGPGGFAEYKVHPADGCYPVGETPFEVAALVEPLSCALHAVRLAGVGVADDAAVLGAGVMGLLNVVALKKHGARVLVSEIDPHRLERARAFGADETIDATSVDPVERVRELTEGRGAAVVVAATGSPAANEQGLAMLAERGRYVLFASAHPEPSLTLSPNELHDRETAVLGAVSKDKQDFYAAARLVRYGQVDLGPLVDRTYPLGELEAALAASLERGTYRIVVTA